MGGDTGKITPSDPSLNTEDEEFFHCTFLVTVIGRFFLWLVFGASDRVGNGRKLLALFLLSSAPVRSSALTIARKSERFARPKFGYATHPIIRVVRVDTRVTG